MNTGSLYRARMQVKAVMKKPREYGTLLPMSFRVDLAEKLLLDRPEAHVKCETFHHFGPGVCIREVHIPAGTLLIGHEHVGETANAFVEGSLRLLQEDGSWQTLHAPMFLVSPPGRKVAITLTDCIWQNILATTETDPQVIESLFVRKSKAFLEKEQQLCLSEPSQLALEAPSQGQR